MSAERTAMRQSAPAASPFGRGPMAGLGMPHYKT